MNDSVRKIKNISLVEQVLRHLREDFLGNVYPVGSALPSEQNLAERYGVSRLTLRSALQKLGSEGWIKTSQGRTSEVLDYTENIGLESLPELLLTFPKQIISCEDFSIYYRFKQWLGGTIHLAACRKAGPSHTPKLIGIVSEFREDLGLKEIWELDFKFYLELTRITENIILTMFQNTHRNIYRYLIDVGAIVEPDYPIPYYSEMLVKLTNAICSNNEQAVRDLHPELITESNKSMTRLFENIAKMQ
ncbi:MAG: GntR family transcriptional regulator [Proteobacteria bacterium]|nr:GntR family transcriptional regulator [Pseudomonadota bacterium]